MFACTPHSPHGTAAQALTPEQRKAQSAFVAERAFLQLEVEALESALAHYGVGDAAAPRDTVARTSAAGSSEGAAGTAQ